MASCGMIYIPSFMKIGRGIQAIIRFSLKNLKSQPGRNCQVVDTSVHVR
jgi:hypothetical protein